MVILDTVLAFVECNTLLVSVGAEKVNGIGVWIREGGISIYYRGTFIVRDIILSFIAIYYIVMS